MRIPQSQQEFMNHLKEQLQFLRASMAAYDAGFEGEAKRLALTMRVLLHDTKRSQSLLSLLQVKHAIQYFDLIGPRDFDKAIAFVGLRMKFTDKGMRYFYNPSKPEYKAGFDEWWERVVILNKVGNVRFTRRSIILSVADMDGGGHVDASLDADYVGLSRNNSFGWEVGAADATQIVENGPELPAVRQTAHELELSLSEHFAL